VSKVDSDASRLKIAAFVSTFLLILNFDSIVLRFALNKMGGRVSVSAFVLYIALPLAHFLYWYNAARGGLGSSANGLDCARSGVALESKQGAPRGGEILDEWDCGEEIIGALETSVGAFRKQWIPERSSCASINFDFNSSASNDGSHAHASVLETVPTHAILDYKGKSELCVLLVRQVDMHQCT